MTQSTILAVGLTAATSTDIVVAAGAVVTVGVFTDSVLTTPVSATFTVVQDTPGIDLEIAPLGAGKSLQLAGPGTFRVKRSLSTGKPYGVFLEA